MENGDQAINSSDLVLVLKDIENLCSKEAYNRLCYLLSLNKLKDDPEYRDWTMEIGRLNCFEVSKNYILEAYDLPQPQQKCQKNRLTQIMSEAISFEHFISESVPTNSINQIELLFDGLTVHQRKAFDTEHPNCSNIKVQKESKNKIAVDQSTNFHTITDNNPIPVSASVNIGSLKSNLSHTIVPQHQSNIIEPKDNNPPKVVESKMKIIQPIIEETYSLDPSLFTELSRNTDLAPIRTGCFSPDGNYVAIGTNSQSLKILSLANIIQNYNPKQYTFNPTDDIPVLLNLQNHHVGSIYCVDWAIPVNGRLIATGSNDKVIKIIVKPDLDTAMLKTDQEILELSLKPNKSIVRSLSFSPVNEGHLISVGAQDSQIKLWDTEKGSIITEYECNSEKKDLNTVKFSNDGNIAICGGDDSCIRFWDIRGKTKIEELKDGSPSGINDISIDNKNNIIAAYKEGRVSYWEGRKLIQSVVNHLDETRSVSISNSSNYVCSAGFDNNIFIMNKELEEVKSLHHDDRAVCSRWHPTLPLILTTSADKTARLWGPLNKKP